MRLVPLALASSVRHGSGSVSAIVCVLAAAVVLAAASSCTDYGKVSAQHARSHVELVAGFVARDVEQVRQGLPQGATQLAELWRAKEDPALDPQLLKKRLERVRERVFELSIAKTTFSAIASPDGLVLRSDQDVDILAGKSLFAAFPGLKGSTTAYTETVGELAEIAGVKGKPDGQWLAAGPIKANEEFKAVYAAGWSWARYCYSLEEGLRSSVRTSLVADDNSIDKEPLIYVFLLAAGQVFSAPTSPQFNADAIGRLDLLNKASGQELYSAPLEIDHRAFGMAVKRTPALGENVAVVVLRSET